MNQNLIQDYRQLDFQLAAIADMLNGEEDFEADLFIPDQEHKLAAESQISSARERLDSLDAPDPVSILLKSHFSDYLDAQTSELRAIYKNPAVQIGDFSETFEFLLTKDSRADLVKAELMIGKLSRTVDMFQAMDSWLTAVKPVYLLETAEACRTNVKVFTRLLDQLKTHLPDLPDNIYGRLQSAFQTFITQNRSMQAKLELRLKQIALPEQTTEDSILKLDPEVYAAYLLLRHGVVLSELLDWHEEEIARTRQSVLTIASRLRIPEAAAAKSMADVNAILLKYAGPAASAAEMLQRGNEYIKRTAAACKDFVWLPEESCSVVNISKSLKDSYPWGGYGGGCKRRRPLQGEMFLNGYNYRAVTDGWIKMNTVHEAYPGHHVQFVRNIVDPIPETLKRGARYTPILEGVPHRSEELFTFVFPEDPFYPLFVAYRRHHTAVRIKADLMLRYFGYPIKDVVRLYCSELDFDWNTARGQVRAQEYMPGYFNCYYYGFKLINQWEQEYDFDQKEYTELLFSAARMSMSNFKRFLDLTEAERHSLLNNYASLYQFADDYSEKPD
ncbi:MAG: DUF885 family protein [Saccharofermentanales bacterium]|nr:DUF885 family protein [Bacillota bacterium]NLB08760.1 DUF885 domain-containing protein [Clostridiales bacterium]